MEGFLLQDWTTIRADASETTVKQSERFWLDTERYRDIVFWLELANAQTGGATSVVFYFETATSKDDALFVNMASPLTIVGLTVTKVLETQAVTPLADWVRWRIGINGTPTSAWGASFRIHCAMNPTGVF